MYDMNDPLAYLNETPSSKSAFKELVATKIAAFHEKEMKITARNNSKMKFLNLILSSLRGRHHPCLANLITVNEVKKSPGLTPTLKKTLRILS